MEFSSGSHDNDILVISALRERSSGVKRILASMMIKNINTMTVLYISA